MDEREARGEPEPTLVEIAPETAGRYVLRHLIGKGATGEVWRADDPEIGRAVAVKLLRMPDGLPDDERTHWEQRFLLEARAAGGLSHPGVVPVYDVGRTSEGRAYMVMELVQGRSLDALLQEGAPPPAQALQWCAQVAEALDAAHRHGIVHRDIKPANIIIGADQRARVLDFGIARMAKSDLTRTGLFVGSPAYASPEQLQGLPVDGRSDIFSLGATLFALLAGARPFQGDDLPNLVYSICHREPPSLGRHAAGLPPGTETVVSKALAKDPARRYQSGQEFSAALRALAEKTSSAPHAGAGAAAGSGRDFEHLAHAIRAAAGAFLVTAHAAGRQAWAWSSSRWRRGWEKGPRARFAMTASATIVLLAIVWGGVLIHQKLEQRQTPAQKFKKAFSSFFSGR